uniref:lysocardiolipin acyltransferase 1 n=1 Tax=Ciona intestinalis TaxID=7719 RepID=UPI000180CA3C|nr:lysocardiolipin acyltransferase 1 [Ciona intestinalis]|eukprot:XP_009857602.1 lysocardiolipin acyltransferase 1 [Ciona intestinalis]
MGSVGAGCGLIGGVFSVSFLFITCLYGSIFIYGPVLPLMVIWPWLYRRVVEVLSSMWQTQIVTCFELLQGMKVVVTGDAIQRHEKTMVLMNHRTRLDWLYFFPYVFHARILNRQKIALKSMLKWIPGLGWAMQVAGYIFLDRQWEADQVHISNILSYFVELESKPNILFFAEGTDFNEGSKKRSKEYARKSGLTEFEYVLQPRTTGFTYFVNHLRNISGIHAVHDVTIAYPYEILHNELELIKAGAPRAVHFHIKRYSISELPEDQDELGKWCQNLWAEKEALLKEYYSEPNPDLRRFKCEKKPPQDPRTFLLILGFCAWSAITVFCTYLVVVSSFARYYALMMILFYLSSGYLLGGVEKLEMILFEQFKKPRPLWGRRNSGRGEIGGGDAYYTRLNRS